MKFRSEETKPFHQSKGFKRNSNIKKWKDGK